MLADHSYAQAKGLASNLQPPSSTQRALMFSPRRNLLKKGGFRLSRCVSFGEVALRKIVFQSLLSKTRCQKWGAFHWCNCLAGSSRSVVFPASSRATTAPDFINKSVCSFLNFIKVGTLYIEPGSPWQSVYVESFHSRYRDECLASELFDTVAEAQAVIELLRQTYNHRRHHSGLGVLTPVEFSP